MTFREALEQILESNIDNEYLDNFDVFRFGKERKRKEIIHRFLVGLGITGFKQIFYGTETYVKHIIRKSKLFPFLDRFSWLYNKLDDEASRSLLIQLLAYRILGFRKVKLPLSTFEYWENIRNIDKMGDHTDFIDTGFNSWKLYKTTLRLLGFPIEIYYTAVGIYTEFVLRQYEYRCDGVRIGVSPGDIVIDGGACWGETALYFAHEAGSEGRVFSLEFIPSNMNNLRKNLGINPSLAGRVSVIKRPLWKESGKKLYYSDNGPGSSVSFERQPESSGEAETVSIDDLVTNEGLLKVDFIKLDIEGAEIPALHGAIDTIRRFRPKLAIAIYHSLDDFVEIPAFLDSLDLGYTFHLGHYSIHSEETVLFAIVKKD